jgi:hypothetical protein
LRFSFGVGAVMKVIRSNLGSDGPGRSIEYHACPGRLKYPNRAARGVSGDLNMNLNGLLHSMRTKARLPILAPVRYGYMRVEMDNY